MYYQEKHNTIKVSLANKSLILIIRELTQDLTSVQNFVNTLLAVITKKSLQVSLQTFF